MLLDVIIKFCIDLWGFSIDPPYFGYNFARQENLFCVFWHFRNLPELQLTWDFLFVNIWSQEAPRAQEVNEVGHEAQKSTCGMVTMPDHTTYACLALEPPMSSVFISYRLAWPKNVYRKTPQSVLVRRWWRNTKPRNRGCFSEDWRGKHCRSCPRSLLQPLQHHQHHQDWRGSIPPRDYGFVAVPCSISLLCYNV
jgi:hypothetical protein